MLMEDKRGGSSSDGKYLLSPINYCHKVNCGYLAALFFVKKTHVYSSFETIPVIHFIVNVHNVNETDHYFGYMYMVTEREAVNETDARLLG